MDYHSVDGGDLLTGRPYGYTEEYQSYEQTGTEQYQTGTTPTYGPYWSSGAQCPYANMIGSSVLDGYCTYPRGPQQGFSDGRCASIYDSGEYIRWWWTSCHQRVQTGSTPTYGTRPVYGYVPRQRTITYDKQSGLFSIGIGVPYTALNGGLYSTRSTSMIHMTC